MCCPHFHLEDRAPAYVLAATVLQNVRNQDAAAIIESTDWLLVSGGRRIPVVRIETGKAI